MRASSQRVNWKYRPVIRDAKGRVVWSGVELCGNRDETTPFNFGASNLASLVLKAVREREKIVDDIAQPVPAALCWAPCDCCDEFVCNIHGVHAFECECPPIDEWGQIDPYTTPATEAPDVRLLPLCP